ncbi:uncharacterized protein LOC129928171 [Biomphalaria glabrata]|uniref:Uncharacterized protein LOC129928171 n=1 Tax=Biomphalaria glabrata TaxID=6526 RepID=A0A9W3BCL6_BIOGL|nr:uncharacterized protein LOC129928171 [Biomphalaria glabrata]
MTTEYILKTVCLGLLMTCSLSNARSVTNIPLKRNVATENCQTPTAPPNAEVDCEYSDALQIEIFCTITCKTGYKFNRSDAKDFVFPCDVATGFYTSVTTPDCIPESSGRTESRQLELVWSAVDDQCALHVSQCSKTFHGVC